MSKSDVLLASRCVLVQCAGPSNHSANTIRCAPTSRWGASEGVSECLKNVDRDRRSPLQSRLTRCAAESMGSLVERLRRGALQFVSYKVYNVNFTRFSKAALHCKVTLLKYTVSHLRSLYRTVPFRPFERNQKFHGFDILYIDRYSNGIYSNRIAGSAPI